MVLVPAWPLRTKLISMPLSRSKGATPRRWAAIALALPGNASVPSAAASAWSSSVAVPCHACCAVSTARTAVTTAVASGANIIRLRNKPLDRCHSKPGSYDATEA